MERVLDVARKAAGVLQERGIDQARLESELLLAGVLGVKRLDLYLQHERPLSAAELERYRAVVRRRLKREPIQYILGTTAFRELELRVDPRVLIPRPETELLVGAVLEWSASRDTGAVLDIGTGSGAIALSLAHEGRYARIVATDASLDALDVARDNARRLGLADHVEFRAGPLFAVLADGEQFDVIVSNPPYVAAADRAALAPDVRDHEPAVALFGGSDGLEVIDAILAGAGRWLRPGGLLALEIGADQGATVLARARSRPEFRDARVLRDLAGRERIILAEMAVD